MQPTGLEPENTKKKKSLTLKMSKHTPEQHSFISSKKTKQFIIHSSEGSEGQRSCVLPPDYSFSPTGLPQAENKISPFKLLSPVGSSKAVED